MYNREYRTERGMRYADGDACLKACPKYYVSFGLKLMDFQYEFLSEELTKYENLVRNVLTFYDEKIRAMKAEPQYHDILVELDEYTKINYCHDERRVKQLTAKRIEQLSFHRITEANLLHVTYEMNKKYGVQKAFVMFNQPRLWKALWKPMYSLDYEVLDAMADRTLYTMRCGNYNKPIRLSMYKDDLAFNYEGMKGFARLNVDDNYYQRAAYERLVHFFKHQSELRRVVDKYKETGEIELINCPYSVGLFRGDEHQIKLGITVCGEKIKTRTTDINHDEGDENDET